MKRATIAMFAACLPLGTVLGLAGAGVAVAETATNDLVITAAVSGVLAGTKKLEQRRHAVAGVDGDQRPAYTGKRRATPTPAGDGLMTLRPTDTIDQPYRDVATPEEHQALADAAADVPPSLRDYPAVVVDLPERTGVDPYLFTQDDVDETRQMPAVVVDHEQALIDELAERGTWDAMHVDADSWASTTVPA